jgi:catechol 2,3-dioxygenase-like lactoylglutathione lyase family enzyme
VQLGLVALWSPPCGPAAQERGSAYDAAVEVEPPIRIGLRVPDVVAAAALYERFGFAPFATLPDRDGRPVLVVLRRGPLQLLVDALEGLPFADGPRERQTKTGPRGLGVVIGVAVDDVDAAAATCRAAGCVVTAGPLDAPWGERYAEAEDPFGYAWKFFRVRPPSGGSRG